MIIINQEIILIIINKINKIKIILNVRIVDGLVIFLMNADLKISYKNNNKRNKNQQKQNNYNRGRHHINKIQC